MRNILTNIRTSQVTEIMHLSYTATTSLNFMVETASGDDWEIDWGDGVWEQYAAGYSYKTKTFGTATSGVARVRSATGRELSDITKVRSMEGAWSFDATALYELTSLNTLYLQGGNFTGDMSGVTNLTSLTYLYLQGNSFTGDMSGISNLTSLTYLRLVGNSFTGDMSGISNLTSLTYLRLQGNILTGDMGGVSNLTSLGTLYLSSYSFTLTYSTFTTNLQDLYIRLANGQLSNPADIDQLLIDIDAVATTKTGSFDLRSSGAAAPTAASLSARNSLISKGRTILTN